MAHHNQLEFIGTLSKNMPRYFTNAKVLEIGSLDINGSIRRFFDQCDYTGIDVAEGSGVDVVCEGQKYDAPDGTFDHVVSCETMEHNPYWKETFANMVRLCRPGGLVSMACATYGRGEHGTTRTAAQDSPLTVNLGWEYYRNLEPCQFTRTMDFSEHFSHFGFWQNWDSYDLYFAGIRRGGEDSGTAVEWECVVRMLDETTARHNASVKSRLRKLVAMFGESGFNLIRKLRS